MIADDVLDDEIEEDFRKNLMRIRTENGMSQSDLSRKFGCAPSYISDLEKGRRPSVRLRTVGRLARAMGTTRSALIEKHVEENSENPS